MVLICHPQHPLAKKKTMKIKGLSGQKMVSFEPAIPTRKGMTQSSRSAM